MKEIIGLESETELKPKTSRCSNQKLISGSEDKGDRSKIALAISEDVGHHIVCLSLKDGL